MLAASLLIWAAQVIPAWEAGSRKLRSAGKPDAVVEVHATPGNLGGNASLAARYGRAGRPILHLSRRERAAQHQMGTNFLKAMALRVNGANMAPASRKNMNQCGDALCEIILAKRQEALDATRLVPLLLVQCCCCLTAQLSEHNA